MITLALAGRPNVGKSTLFNRLLGKAMALVDDTPGVTRDWREGQGRLFDLPVRLLDTAGLEEKTVRGSLAARVAEHTRKALGQADVILMLVDGQTGLTAEDRAVARQLRKTGRPVLLLVNKCEGPRLPAGFHEAAGLGFEEPLAVSASHGEGLGELRERLAAFVPEKAAPEAADDDDFSGEREAEEEAEEAEPRHLHLAVVGRPNAGKSTLVNRLLGTERMLTGPEPGVTRDAIASFGVWDGMPVRLVDTAGMRRRARIDDRIEKLSVRETLRTIRLAHVALLVLDAEAPFDKQDYTIAQHVVEEGRALVILVNKWDKVKEKDATLAMIRAKVEASLAQAPGVPILTLSALTGSGLDKVRREVRRIYEVWNKRISTGRLNRWLEGAVGEHPPPLVSGRRVKLRYMTQVKARPPTFAVWVNKPVGLPESYTRFLTNSLRKTFGLEGVPVRWLLRKGDNPYEGERT